MTHFDFFPQHSKQVAKLAVQVLLPCVALANFILVAPATAQYAQNHQNSQNTQTQYSQVQYQQAQYPQAQYQQPPMNAAPDNNYAQGNEQVSQSGQNSRYNTNAYVPNRNAQPNHPVQFSQRAPQTQQNFVPLQNHGQPQVPNAAAHVPNRNQVNALYGSQANVQNVQNAQNMQNVQQPQNMRNAQQQGTQGIQQASYPALRQVNANARTGQPGQNRQVNYRFEDENNAPPIGGQSQNVLPPLKRVAEVPKDAVSQTITLANLNGLEFRRRLVEKLGSRCVAVNNVNLKQNIAHYQMRTAENTLLDLLVDMQNNTLRVTGSRNAVTSFAQIVKLLDTRQAATAAVQTDVVPFQHGNYRAVRRTVSAIVQGQEEAADQRPNGQNAQNGQNGRPANGQVNPVSEASALLGQMTQSGLIGPVQLEVIEGLDLVVIKGNRQDVAIVKNLIDQIERTAAEQEPEIVIHPMKNTDCSRVGTLVRLLYNEIYGTRRGSINITPLVKPNALLLVGKKESIETAISLIEKLDVPVDPTHEFRIVRLKNASSDTVATTITNFYTNRLQLGTQVLVVSDYRTNSLIIQASVRDMDEVLRMIEQMDADHGAAVNEVKVFPLLNADASTLATVLLNALTGSTTTGGFTGTTSSGQRSSSLIFRTIDTEEGELLRSGIMTSDVRVAADTNGNQLIVSAPKDSMPLIASLIKQLDQLPAAESQIRVFTIVNGDASTLYTMLQNLFQTSTTGVGGTGSGNNLTTLPGTEAGESAKVQLRFYYDVRTNSIIAVGTEGNLAVIEALLMKLDEDEIDNRVVTVFRLLNSPATEIASAINDYLTEERQIETSIDTELFSTFEQFRREVVVVAETITNSLIVTATPRFYNDIRRIIKELDDRPPMVIIQVLIAEVSLDNMHEFGVEFGLQDSILFDRSVMSTSTTGDVTASPGFNFNNQPLGNNVNAGHTNRVGTQGLTHLNVGRSNSDSGAGGFVFSASSDSVSVLMRALEERHKVNVLSRPQVNALDNQRASLQVGQKVPYTESNTISNNNNTNLSVQFIPVGIILDVTPRINADGVVSMSIYAEKSKHSMISLNEEMIAPQVAISAIQTVVSAMDGQTIVIGGLISNDTEQTVRAVPYISRIPVLGRLFEYRSNKCTRQELLVIMTPMIVRSQEDMEMIMSRERQRMHWCATDAMGISDSKNLRKRGDYYHPSETTVVPYTGQVPTENMLPSFERTQEQIMVPNDSNASPTTQDIQEFIYENPANTLPGNPPQPTGPRIAPLPR